MVNPLRRKSVKSLVSRLRVASLGTLNPDDTVHLVPVVFESDSRHIYFAIDRKRKKTARNLRRIANIERTGAATILFDKYSENWNKLEFLMIYAEASIISTSKEKKHAAQLLKKKYSQYSQSNRYFPENLNDALFVRLTPKKAFHWHAKA